MVAWWHGCCEARQDLVAATDLSPRLHVLLVDDDARTTYQLARMLREDGYDVSVETDGARARERLGQEPTPGALVTDLRMPHTSGLTLARAARLQNEGLPVIVVTGYPNLAMPLERELDPPPFVLTKPVVYEELHALLRGVAEARVVSKTPLDGKP